MSNNLDVKIKRFSSYFKIKWTLKDYPVEVFINKNAQEKNVVYGAKITNWAGMVGHGETEELAIISLNERFTLFKDNNDSLPRPGSVVPITYASTVEIEKYEDIAVELFQRVFNTDYYSGFYSDEVYFGILELQVNEDVGDSKTYIINAIMHNYGIDVSDIYEQPLWKILKLISETSQ